MPLWRYAAQAERTVEDIIAYSASTFGEEAADRYLRLMLAVFHVLAVDPLKPPSRAVGVEGKIRVFHLRHGLRFVPANQRVRDPRHIVVYRSGADGITDILALVHDRMMLTDVVERLP
jgi:toxin ParE1/3/4